MEHFLEHTTHISFVECELLFLSSVGKPVSSVYGCNL